MGFKGSEVQILSPRPINSDKSRRSAKLLVRFQTVSAYQLKSTPAALSEWGFGFAPTGWLRGMRSFLPVQTASDCSQKKIFYQFLPALKR